MTFIEALREAVSNRELIQQYDRLKGTNLSLKGASMDVLVDIHSGRMNEDLKGFIEFFEECIWERIPVKID